MHGGSAIAWSMDKGKTWSQPNWVHPAQTPSVYAPGLHPVFEQASPWDRPYFVADASTGAIYVSGSGPAYTVESSDGRAAESRSGEAWNGLHRLSTTFGHAWTDVPARVARPGQNRGLIIHAIDSDEYPGGRGASAPRAATWSSLTPRRTCRARADRVSLHGVRHQRGRRQDIQLSRRFPSARRRQLRPPLPLVHRPPGVAAQAVRVAAS